MAAIAAAAAMAATCACSAAPCKRLGDVKSDWFSEYEPPPTSIADSSMYPPWSPAPGQLLWEPPDICIAAAALTAAAIAAALAVPNMLLTSARGATSGDIGRVTTLDVGGEEAPPFCHENEPFNGCCREKLGDEELFCHESEPFNWLFGASPSLCAIKLRIATAGD